MTFSIKITAGLFLREYFVRLALTTAVLMVKSAGLSRTMSESPPTARVEKLS